MSVAPKIDVRLVRQLVAEQFPQWSSLEVRPVEADGWDNRSFRLGDELSVRLPSAVSYASQVGKEVQWLPHLATAVSLPIPEVVGIGAPGNGYPFAWTIRHWIEGVPAASAQRRNLTALAVDLAKFLKELQAADPIGPLPGQHTAGRGAPLHQWDTRVSVAVSALAGRIDGPMALRIWKHAREAEPNRPGMWFHGDIAPGNLLLRNGKLAAVIDFGLAGVGDPACDLAIAWTWFDNSARQTFRDALGVDESTWTRGQGWALWKALISLNDPRHIADSSRVLTALNLLDDTSEQENLL